MTVNKTPGSRRSNGKHTNSIWFNAASPTGFSKLSPDDLLWLMECWQKTLALIHLALTAGANSERASSDPRASHQRSVYEVRMRSNLALETLCRAAEQRGLNSATIRAADLVIRKRLPEAAKWCFSDDGAGCLYRAEDFLCIRFPAHARPTADERLEFKQGIRVLDRLETKLEVESRSSLSLRIPREGTREHDVIQVLFEQEAFDAAHRMTAERITHFADRYADANLYKYSIAKLRRDRWIATKPGKGGGCWLTPLGRQMTSELFKR